MTLHIVTGSVVKVSIGSTSGNRVAHIARRGDVLPEGIDELVLENLVSRGLIEEIEAPDPEAEAAAAELAELERLEAEEKAEAAKVEAQQKAAAGKPAQPAK